MAVQPPNRTIFLVGMMGAGKSTIGKALAALMGTKFVDLDRELEERCGVSIPHIFETEGEAGFRCRETRLLQEYAKASDMVVATGGGVVTREDAFCIDRPRHACKPSCSRGNARRCRRLQLN